MDQLYEWLEQQLRRVPGRSPLAGAMRYGVRHRDGLGQFLDDGRIEIDTNVVERAIRPTGRTRCSPAATKAAPTGRPSPR